MKIRRRADFWEIVCVLGIGYYSPDKFVNRREPVLGDMAPIQQVKEEQVCVCVGVYITILIL